MKKARFQEDNHSCVGSQTWLPPQPGTPEPAAEQPRLLLEPSPAEAEQIALKSAAETYQKAVEAQPDCAWAWYQYGDALLGLNRIEEAANVLRKAVALSPETALFHYDLGLALYELNPIEAASDQFAGIVSKDPELKCAWSGLVLAAMTNLALSQEKMGRRDEAIQTLLPALESAVGTLFNLGFLHFRARRYESALPYVQAAFILKPNTEDIVHLYGSTLSELMRPKEAVKVLKLATELQPACASAWYDLGLAYARLKYRKRARACFLHSLQIDPERAWSHYDLACLDALEAKRNAAFDHLMQAVACGFRDIGHLRQDPDLRSLRRDARWKALFTTISGLAKSNN
jgi:tetratricopeptide (TPR) repeat protein